MFGPNVQPSFHHRSDELHSLWERCERLMQEIFGLQDYHFIFITGSGTLANEIVMSSLMFRPQVYFADGEFAQRLLKMQAQHATRPPFPHTAAAYPLYETDLARFNGAMMAEFLFLDMVSAFPYWTPGTFCNGYDTSKNITNPQPDIFTTVSSKQVGALPVLGIIGIQKDFDTAKYFGKRDGSILSLPHHLDAASRKESLYTPAIPLLQSLADTLQDFDAVALREKIDDRGAEIDKILGTFSQGEGPVRILDGANPAVSRAATNFTLYRNSQGKPQVFLYSGTDDEWDLFISELKKG